MKDLIAHKALVFGSSRVGTRAGRGSAIRLCALGGGSQKLRRGLSGWVWTGILGGRRVSMEYEGVERRCSWRL